MNLKIGCAIPCYLGGPKTIELIKVLEENVDLIVLIDDKCPLNTGTLVSKSIDPERTHIIFNSHNKGVGASTISGFDFLIKHDCDIIVKIDADGQMNPSLIPDLIKPIIEGKADAAKGHRFTSLDQISAMPKIRILGNLGLSFLNKLSTGYWELFDPTNGFIAFKTSSLRCVRIDKVDDRYFFESDLLFQCALAQITFAQLPMISIYSDEISSLRPIREVSRFAGKHLVNFFKRLAYQYFLLDFNAGSLELLAGSFGLILTTIFSIKLFLNGIYYQKYATSGESSIFAILSIVTIQMFIAFMFYDATLQPLMRKLRNKI